MSDEKPRKRSRFDKEAADVQGDAPEEPVHKASRSRFDQTTAQDASSSIVESTEPKPVKEADKPVANSSGVLSTTQTEGDKPATPDTPSTPKDPEAEKEAKRARAAEALAKLNKTLAGRKPPPKPAPKPLPSSQALVRTSDSIAKKPTDSDVYTQGNEHMKDIVINDLRNRYVLTSEATQKKIKEETGAEVTTVGKYYPDKSMATPSKPALTLHVTAQSREELDAAVTKIEQLLTAELPSLVDERRFRRREPEQFERDELGRRKWPEKHIPIDLEPIHGFNLRAQVVGKEGCNVKHIQNTHGVRVQIKGQGSGFYETATGVESDEPMYLCLAGRDPQALEQAEGIARDLIEKVRRDYRAFKDNLNKPPPAPPLTADLYASYGGHDAYMRIAAGYAPPHHAGILPPTGSASAGSPPPPPPAVPGGSSASPPPPPGYANYNAAYANGGYAAPAASAPGATSMSPPPGQGYAVGYGANGAYGAHNGYAAGAGQNNSAYPGAQGYSYAYPPQLNSPTSSQAQQGYGGWNYAQASGTPTDFRNVPPPPPPPPPGPPDS